jgi:hypothetical protein
MSCSSPSEFPYGGIAGTAQKQAEEEAEALRKATLSLTQDLRMDFIMETLLRSLEELVPYTCARVLVPESGPHAGWYFC